MKKKQTKKKETIKNITSTSALINVLLNTRIGIKETLKNKGDLGILNNFHNLDTFEAQTDGAKIDAFTLLICRYLNNVLDGENKGENIEAIKILLKLKFNYENNYKDGANI